MVVAGAIGQQAAIDFVQGSQADRPQACWRAWVKLGMEMLISSEMMLITTTLDQREPAQQGQRKIWSG